MAEEYVSKSVCEALCEGLKAEDKRQNERLDSLEATVHQINALTVSVEKMALSIDTMTKQLVEQSGRMTKLEGRDGENWKKVVSGIITGVIGGLVVFVMNKLGFSV